MPTISLSDKRRRAGALMSEAGLMNFKADVLIPYGVERIRDLTDDQLDDLNERLAEIVSQKKQSSKEMRAARSTVLGLCDDLGIKAKGGNWTRVNEFLMQKRIAGKLLFEMNLKELKTCAKRIRAMKKKVDEKIEQEKTWAQNN